MAIDQETLQEAVVQDTVSPMDSVLQFQTAPEQPEASTKHPGKIRQWLGRGALSVLAVVSPIVAGTVGATTTETPISIGPLKGTAHLTTDGYATLETTNEQGDPSSLVVQLDTPLDIGINVHVDNAPISISSTGITATTQSERLKSEYASLFANYGDDVKSAERKLKSTFLLYASLGEAAVLAAYWTKRRYMKDGGMAAMLMAGTIFATNAAGIGAIESQTKQSPSPEACITTPQDMPFDCLYAGGELLQLIINDKLFYDKAVKNVGKAFENLPEPNGVKDNKSLVKILVFGGGKGNVGMFRVAGAVEQESGAVLNISRGDNEQGDSPLDSYFEDSLNKQLGGHTEEARGNHDAHTGEVDKEGVPKPRTVRYKGVTMSLVDDPVETDTYGPADPSGDLALRKKTGHALAVEACEEHPDIAVANQWSVLQETLERDCAGLGVVGSIKGGIETFVADNGAIIPLIKDKGIGGAIYKKLYHLKRCRPCRRPAK